MRHPIGYLLVFASMTLAVGCTEQPDELCAPGEEICNAEGTESFICVDGAWETKTACTGVSEYCAVVDGEAQCLCQDGVQVCSADVRAVNVCSGGAWTQQEACAESEVCNYDGEAEAVVCMGADVACDPNHDRERCRVVSSLEDSSAKYTADAYTCALNGRWEMKTACSEAQVCVMRLTDPEVVAEDPLFKEVAVCESIPCQEGREYCPAGSANGNPHVCENGVLVKTEDCSDDTACVIDPEGEAVCVSWWTCTPGQERCDGSGNAVVCSDEQRWETLEECAETQACAYFEGEAMCVRACIPGEQQCSSNKTAQTCGDDRKWYDVTLCADDEECVVNEGTATCRQVSPL